MSALAEAAAPSRIGVREIGWLGIALGALAWFIALPPILLRTRDSLAPAGAGGGGVLASGWRARASGGWATARWRPA